MSSTTPANSVFFWCGPGERVGQRINYQRFVLNSNTFNLGDCVYLFPEDEGQPHYIGRIRSAFIDESSSQIPPPHNIEIKWFERRVNLEQSTKGIEESEKEVFELEDTDINPIGCISGKCYVIRASTYEEAQQSARGARHDWFFCRGYFLQASNSFRQYTERELRIQDGIPVGPPPISSASLLLLPPLRHGLSSQAQPHGSGTNPEESIVPEPVPLAIPSLIPVPHTMPTVSQQPPLNSAQVPTMQFSSGQITSHPQMNILKDEEYQEGAGGNGISSKQRPTPGVKTAANKRKATGRVCVECGATSTPQWREGPAGPKTLCNACGVRHVRAQQRANKRLATTSEKGPSLSAPGSPVTAGGGRNKAKANLDLDTAARMVPEPSTRPVRQAALASLSRTAAFARTGEFPDEDEAAATGMAHHMRRGARATVSHDHHSADSEGLDSSGHITRGLHATTTHLPPQQQRQRLRLDPSAASGLLALSSIASEELEAHQSLPLLPLQPSALQSSNSGGLGSPLLSLRPGMPSGDATLLTAGLWTNADSALPSSFNAHATTLSHSHVATDEVLDPFSTIKQGGPPNGRAAAAAYCAHVPRSSRPSQPLMGLIKNQAQTLTTSCDVSCSSLPAAGDILPIKPEAGVHNNTTCATSNTFPSPPLGLAAQSLGGQDSLHSPLINGELSLALTQSDFAALLLRMCKHQPELEAYSQAFNDAERSGTRLPESLLHKLAEVKARVDAVSREAAAADAAVQAVEQVYTVRQEAAERAREAAALAGFKLKEYIASLAANSARALTPEHNANDGVQCSSVLEDAAVHAALGAMSAAAAATLHPGLSESAVKSDLMLGSGPSHLLKGIHLDAQVTSRPQFSDGEDMHQASIEVDIRSLHEAGGLNKDEVLSTDKWGKRHELSYVSSEGNLGFSQNNGYKGSSNLSPKAETHSSSGICVAQH
ncbi:hypothetical protein CEUSTIGMA_g10620.t1 [Chlamydomonas eustigma]|uniref:GATA-type domain-containing protein n=1 Tax=Chlamydomonas eustigma TaxID=1157962 RepID=A0A250XJE5_9CHLO|nr:hypothetical protein CEUSTIGMA_g10620.t1 [Chlamydomonas eustigma]|eukprot:GAX83194.1 hypothetical protein CEUSTIGMA_g10620.t1 [Chlamydomonas eustigma]